MLRLFTSDNVFDIIPSEASKTKLLEVTMELTIGQNIKKFRQERGLTQEELAAHLGISFQSISKWERCDGYPDITMLPVLANYFGVTVDKLIGADAAVNTEKYRKINEKWAENNKAGLNKENILLMRNALKTYPNDALLLVQLSTSLEKADGTESERSKYLKESIALQEQIIRYADDCEVRGATLFNICFSYRKNGELDKAIEQAKKLPNLYKGRENALLYFLSGDEKNTVAREALQPLAWSIAHHLTALAETENSHEYIEKAKQILDILLECNKDDFIMSIRKKLNAK